MKNKCWKCGKLDYLPDIDKYYCTVKKKYITLNKSRGCDE